MLKISFLFFLSLILMLLGSKVYAFNPPSIIYPSEVYEGRFLFFEPSQGSIVSRNVESQKDEVIAQISPTEIQLYQLSSTRVGSEVAILEMRASPDHSKVLVYATNDSFEAQFPDYPFYSDEQSFEALWWVYDLETQEVTQLNPLMDFVSWYSDNEIIYVFSGEEVSIAPIERLNEFRVVGEISQGISQDPLEEIRFGPERTLVPVQGGYVLFNEGEQYSLVTEGQASVSSFAEQIAVWRGTSLQSFSWSGQLLQEFSLEKSIVEAYPLRSGGFVVLFDDNAIEVLNGQGNVLDSYFFDQVISLQYKDSEQSFEVLVVLQDEVRTIFPSTSSSILNTSNLGSSQNFILIGILVGSIILGTLIFGVLWIRRNR